jgi:hypothetical protein
MRCIQRCSPAAARFYQLNQYQQGQFAELAVMNHSIIHFNVASVASASYFSTRVGAPMSLPLILNTVLAGNGEAGLSFILLLST